MFAAVCDLGLEGIVSKKIECPYKSGLKIKIRRRPRLPGWWMGAFDS
jgi:ATP-dependent DNA ligase